MDRRSSNEVTLRVKLFAHLEMFRPYTVIWCGLVSLAGSCFAYGDFPPLRTALLVLFIPMMGWVAGLYLSDFLDRELDKIQKPHRPIPSGRVRPGEALMVGAVLAFTGFILSFFLTLNNVLLVFVVAVLVFTYAKVSKSRGIFGNLNRGVVIVVAYVFGVFSADQSLQTLQVFLWFLIPLFFLHDTTSNLVGAIRDREGDKKGGYRTIPVRYGVKVSLVITLFLSVLYILWMIGVLYYFQVLVYPYRFLLLFFLELLVLVMVFVLMFRSLGRMDRKRALQAHEFFVAERTILASALIMGMVSLVWVSSVIFIGAMVVTLGSQYLIRKKYEFTDGL